MPEKFDVARGVRPEPTDEVVTDGWQLHGLCHRRGIHTLLYAGFMADVCLMQVSGAIDAPGVRAVRRGAGAGARIGDGGHVAEDVTLSPGALPVREETNTQRTDRMPLRVGIIGFETGTHWTGYTNAAQQSPAVELAAIALRPEMAEPIQEQIASWRVPVYEDAGALLARERIDVLALSTVPNEQAPLILEGLRRGLHVVADKPLVTTHDDLQRVRRALAEQPGRRISMLMTIRGEPVRQAAYQLVRQGALGQLAMFHTRRAYAQRRESRAPWFFDEALSGGPWADGAIHGIDEVRWISGLAYREVVAMDANVSWPEQPRFYDHGQALFAMEQDVHAIVEHHRQSINDSWLSILGTDAKIEIDRRNQGTFVDATGERPLQEVLALPPPKNVFADFCESIVANKPALIDTADTLATMEAVLAVREAARSGQRVRLG